MYKIVELVLQIFKHLTRSLLLLSSLCGQVGHIKPECPELKKLLNERNRKTQIKINLIKEYEINSDNEELISELDFESDNSSIYSLEDEIEEFF